MAHLTNAELVTKWGDHLILGPILNSLIAMANALTLSVNKPPSDEVMEEFEADIDHLIDTLDDALNRAEILHRS
jgi:hypothetical protein